MITSALIKKYPNKLGNYQCQYVEDGKFKVCCFKTFEDAITTAFFCWCLPEQQDFENSILLKRL